MPSLVQRRAASRSNASNPKPTRNAPDTGSAIGSGLRRDCGTPRPTRRQGLVGTQPLSRLRIPFKTSTSKFSVLEQLRIGGEAPRWSGCPAGRLSSTAAPSSQSHDAIREVCCCVEELLRARWSFLSMLLLRPAGSCDGDSEQPGTLPAAPPEPRRPQLGVFAHASRHAQSRNGRHRSVPLCWSPCRCISSRYWVRGGSARSTKVASTGCLKALDGRMCTPLPRTRRPRAHRKPPERVELDGSWVSSSSSCCTLTVRRTSMSTKGVRRSTWAARRRRHALRPADSAAGRRV